MQLLKISKTALSRMSKAKVIILFSQLRKAFLLEIENKTRKIEELSQRIETLEREKDTDKRKAINKESNQPSSKKPEWDKDGNPKTRKKSRQKGRKKRPGCGNKKKDAIVADETNYNPLNQCPDCGKDLTYQEASEQPTRIVEDIIEPPNKAIIFKEIQERKWCSTCKKIVSSKTEKALPGSDIGLNTLIITAYFWVITAMSLPNIKGFLSSFMKLTISTAGLSQSMIRLSEIFNPIYDEILEDVKAGFAIWADETGWRIKGKLWWLWVFANKRSAYYWPDKSRGGCVVEKILGKIFLGVLITDAWGAYKAIICQKQTCMAHIFRKIRKFIEAYPHYRSILKFYLKLRRIIRDGVKLQKIRADIGERVYQRRLKLLKNRLEKILKWKNPNPILLEIIKKVRRQKKYILTFVEYEGIDHHNNYGEYIIKKGILKRKVSGGSMSIAGANAYACIQSIAQTCQLRGISFFDFLRVTLIHYIRHGKPMLLSEYEIQQKQKLKMAA
jgi:transposase